MVETLSVLEAFDNYLYKVRAERLLEAAVNALSGKRRSDIDDAVALFEKELGLIARALRYRTRLQELLVELEGYSRFKREVLRVYTEKLGINPGDKPRLRICRNYGNESVCIATSRTTRWIGDNTVYAEFKRYLKLKKAAASALKQYMLLLEQAEKSDHAWVRKLARYLLREARGYKKTLQELSSSRST